MGNYCLMGPESPVYKTERVLEMDDVCTFSSPSRPGSISALAVVGSSHSPSAAGVLPLDSHHLSAPYCARDFSQHEGTFWASL